MGDQDILKEERLREQKLKFPSKVGNGNLGLRMNERHSLLVYGDEKMFGIVWIGRLFDLEESRSKSWPAINDFQKRDFGIFWRHSRVRVVALDNVSFPILRIKEKCYKSLRNLTNFISCYL